MARQGGIADVLLYQLAEDIETGDQMEALGLALGFKAAAINRYTETNRIEGLVTCKGTRAMLFDWRQTVKPCDQHLRLKQALTEAKLVMLADTFLKGIPSITDISSEKISESLTVQQCREKLKNKYLHELCKIQMKPWDHNDYAEFKDMHTMVTMVKKDARGQDTNMKEILQGSVSDIFSTKVNGILPARILISAPAGRGKTTAVAKMAYDWVHREKGSALEHLPLLFVVKFRNTGQLTSIGEAIKSQLLSDVDDLTPEGLESFIRKNQGICHIILDGLDEYAGIPSTNQSLMSNIVNVIRWKEFPECRVLVTTRPHLENFFNQAELPRVYTKMWIEGFSRKSSRDYIDKFFASISNPNKGHGLKAYLDIQPLIDELVITPLFCLMVCHLWSNGLLDSGTTTQTELLDNVNVFLMQHSNARSESRVKIKPKMLRKLILQLGEVALTGLLDDAKQLVFTPHDFRRVPAILDMACKLGIVSKTTVSSTCLPQSNETTSTTIEFYHKIAQEHSAGKFLADQTYHFLLHFKKSKLDRVLRKIKANIGDYENLIRFAAGTDNKLCIRIMEMLLTNNCLDESERYRILLDCSSETTNTEGGVSSLVRRCVNAESIVLKSPTVYTVVGMQNLPKQLKREVRTVKFEGSILTADVTSGLWSCLGSFPMLCTLTISDSSLSFHLSPPELPSVTKLSTESVTSQRYEGLLSSLPGLTEIDIIIGNAERDIYQITSGLRRTGGQQLTTMTLEAPSSLPSWKTYVSTETMRGLGHLIRTQTKNLQWLWLSRLNCNKEEDLVELVESWRHVKTLNHLMFLGCGTRKDGRLGRHVISQKSRMVIVYHDDGQLVINNCYLSSEITVRIWSCLRTFTSLNQLTISDSSLSFPPSPHMLPSVTKLSTEGVTSQSYEGLLSSLPGLTDIDITIDDAERDIPQITSGLRRTGGQQLTTIRLETPSSLPSEKKRVSTETMGGLVHLIRIQTKKLQWLLLSRVNCRKEEDLVELVESCRHVKTLNLIMFLGCGTQTGGKLERHVSELLISHKPLMVIVYHDNGQLVINNCHLSSEMTFRIWSCLRSFASLNQLTISDSCLSFPPSPPMLPSVTKLSTHSVTSQNYEGLLSSLPGLRDIDITIDDAERDIPQITAGLRRTGGQQLTTIKLEAPSTLPSGKKSVSRETMRGLGHLIRKQTKNLQWLLLSRVNCRKEEDLVELVESCRHVKTLNLIMFLGCGTQAGGKLKRHVSELLISHKSLMAIVYHDNVQLVVDECHLSSEITVWIWSCLRSFTSLNQLTISDSSLSFPPSPPMLPSVTKLSTEKVTSQSYEGLLSSLPGLTDIDISIYDAEGDIPKIMAGLRRTGGQQLTHLKITATPPFLSEKKSVSGVTIRGLGLLIRKQTENLQQLHLTRVKCTDEEDLVYLIECCRHVKTISTVLLYGCGTREGGRLESYLESLQTSPHCDLSVWVLHDYGNEGRFFYSSHIG